MTDNPTEARDALAWALSMTAIRRVYTNLYSEQADAILAALPDGWTLARREAGVSVTVEALLDAWEAQDPPSIDAAIQTALTTEATR